jgi:hypothetical protein
MVCSVGSTINEPYTQCIVHDAPSRTANGKSYLSNYPQYIYPLTIQGICEDGQQSDEETATRKEH